MMIVGGLVGIFLLSALMRVYQPQSRPHQWLNGSRAFTNAVLDGDWASTYWLYHPGVTTMAVAGPAILVAEKFPHQAMDLLRWAVPSTITGYGWRVMWGAMALGVFIAAVIAAITWVLLLLSNARIAFTAGFFMAISPFFISQSHVLSIDGQLSALMMLSAVLMLLYMQRRRWFILVLSGIVGGLAMLTKTPGLYLVPYAGLVLGTYLVLRLRREWNDHAEGRVKWMLGNLARDAMLPFAIWLVCFAAVFSMWPSMWVDPAGTLRNTVAGTVLWANIPHNKSRFFAGQIVLPDSRPSILFYPVTSAFHLTAVSFVLVLVSVGFYTIWRRRTQPSLSAESYWLLVAYIVFYTLQMILSAKQDQRYIVPADLAFQILAAVGLAGVMAVVEQVAERGQLLALAVAGTALAYQVAIVAVFVPDYGPHRNYLLGGNQVARRIIEISGDQNEGAQYVAEYLAAQAPTATVIQTPKVKLTMDQYLPGEQMISEPESEAPPVDFVLFDQLSIQRGLYRDYWENNWRDLQSRPPQMRVLFDGVEHFRLVATDPSSDLPHDEIDRGWGGFIAVAWLWTLGLIGLLVWALPRLKAAVPSA